MTNRLCKSDGRVNAIRMVALAARDIVRNDGIEGRA